MSINLSGRHFLTLKDFTSAELQYLLNLSQSLKIKKIAGVKGNLLSGKNIVLLFEKASTRTRCAFEVAAFQEGAQVTFLDNSHFGEKESIEDSARVLGRYYDGIEFRGYEQSAVEELAKYAGVPVWNGLTNQFHPTQALADLLTIKEHVDKPLHQVKLVFVGDAHNNVCHSLMIAATKMGMNFVALAPKEYFPDKELFNEMQKEAKITGATLRFTDHAEQALLNADVIYTDVWISMGDESEMKERIQQLTPYQVNMDMLKLTGNSKVKFMHCLPACHDLHTELAKKILQEFGLREMEVTDEVFRSHHSIVFDQSENRLHTIKAVMVATIGC